MICRRLRGGEASGAAHEAEGRGKVGGCGRGDSPPRPELSMICRRPGGRRNGGLGGQRPPTENLNDLPPAGRPAENPDVLQQHQPTDDTDDADDADDLLLLQLGVIPPIYYIILLLLISKFKGIRWNYWNWRYKAPFGTKIWG